MARGRRRDRQAVRLLSIFLLLLQGGRPSIQELAARFKTRRETIYRDLHALGDVGIPVEGDESGRLSRPRLSAEYRLRFAPVPLTRQEIAALVWAVKASGSRQPFQAALSTALPKLQTFATPRDGRLAVAVDGAVAGWERGVKPHEALGPTLLRLLEASVSRRRCVVEYRLPGRPPSPALSLRPPTLEIRRRRPELCGFTQKAHSSKLGSRLVRRCMSAKSRSVRLEGGFVPCQPSARSYTAGLIVHEETHSPTGFPQSSEKGGSA